MPESVIDCLVPNASTDETKQPSIVSVLAGV
jgi:hypothetical protein